MIFIFLVHSFLCLLCSTFLHLLTKLEVNKGVLQQVTKRAVTGADSISGESPGVSVGVGRVGAWTAAAAGRKREEDVFNQQHHHSWHDGGFICGVSDVMWSVEESLNASTKCFH